jgi:hypothetical protein
MLLGRGTSSQFRRRNYSEQATRLHNYTLFVLEISTTKWPCCENIDEVQGGLANFNRIDTSAGAEVDF